MRLLYFLFLGLLLDFVTNAAPEHDCSHGYIKIGTICTDDNECEDDRCGENAKCMNTDGSYYCTCASGYRTKSRKVNFTDEACKDINECNDDKPICGNNAVCSNTPGSYYCTCASGFRSSSGQKTFHPSQGVTCKDVCTDGASLCGERGVCKKNVNECVCNAGFTNYAFKNMSCTKLQCDRLLSEINSLQVPKQFKQIVSGLQNICAEPTTVESSDSGRLQLHGETLLEKLLGAIDDLLSGEPVNTPSKVTAFFQIVEYALKIAGPILKRHFKKTSRHTQLEVLVSRGTASPQGPHTMYTNNMKLESYWETAAGEEYLGFATVSLLSYNKLGNVFDQIKREENQNFKIASEVVTISVTNPKPIHLKKPVTLTFFHLQAPENNVSCAFWDSTLNGGAWSTSGCTLIQSNITHSVCSCEHLSSFAVLMALHEFKDPFELQLITWIGLSLSMICLLICILTFHFVHSIKSTRTTIHLNLCISLFIADLVFLSGISQTENKVGCAFVAGMLHFFFLAVFCWMLLEGLQLFRMVVLVFNTTVNSYYLMAAGYGVPALIVTISAIINAKGYGTKRHCWLNLEKGFIWSFFGPVCVIITVNVFFFLITVWKLAEKFSSLNPDFSKLRKLKTFTITAIAQLCVLGTMWVFGCFQFDENTLAMSYLFTILNSLQGVMVFIMHCLLVKQVRDVYANKLRSLCGPQKKKYNEFSTNQTSKSQGSKSGQNTGESQF